MTAGRSGMTADRLRVTAAADHIDLPPHSLENVGPDDIVTVSIERKA